MSITTKAFKIYGAEGHRQRMSFGNSRHFDWSEGDCLRIVELFCSDVTKTNEYAVMRITMNTAEEVDHELRAQIYDGLFEDSRTGDVIELASAELKKEIAALESHFKEECEEIADSIEENGGYSHGSDYELRCSSLYFSCYDEELEELYTCLAITDGTPFFELVEEE